jgi:SecD/SecF fusion protein
MKTVISLPAVACGMAAVLSLGAATACGAPPGEKSSGSEVGTTLIYEIEPIPKEKDRDTAKRVIKALNWRVNPGWWPQGRIAILDDGRIEIGIYGNDAAKALRIERLVERIGTLEFRIVANNHDHREIIKRARGEKGKELKDADGKLVAQWVPAASTKTAAGIVTAPELATRPLQGGGHEVLVIDDDYNVTGDYLKQAVANTDPQGRPAISFMLISEGGKRFERLTGNNLPDPTTGFTRRLGIILDGRVLSSPSIRSTISDLGQITGNFTKQEVEEIVAVLNAGSLPARITLVEKRTGPVPEAKDKGKEARAKGKE